ncbi:DNA replication and repair protein RecF [Candidatus Saccharibacteria bacterium]|nr:MAG: DNA replication and repair protein RecF [Candidatus Saccharibacteria bacterium]
MISSIRLQQFRSYLDTKFEFGDGVNVIVGSNGSGKTNLLEAVLVAARGGSYRVADADLIHFGKEWARLDALFDASHNRTIKLTPHGLTKKTYTIDDKQYTRLADNKKHPVVLFEPNHLLLLQGAPENRRNYLDDILEQTTPGYTSFRKNYKRVLAQRNALLKHRNAFAHDYFPWNLRLSELGAVIHRARSELTAELHTQIDQLYGELSKDKKRVTVEYSGQFAAGTYESQLLHALESNISREIDRGFTTHGPHREDFKVLFDGVPSTLTASRGEVRSATLALKILELQVLERVNGVKPLLLLDDVFSELDVTRRSALTTHLQHYQTLLTTTEADIVKDDVKKYTVISLEGARKR